MAQYKTHKRTAEGKKNTLERKNIRRLKYAPSPLLPLGTAREALAAGRDYQHQR